jgi:PD-(D/E)XK endonuclease
MRSLLRSPETLSRHPVDVGQRSEAAILAALVKRGHRVLLPYGTNHRYDADQIDLFLVYCPETDRVYAVGVDEVGSGYGFLRVAPTANGQSKRIRWAADYELPA